MSQAALDLQEKVTLVTGYGAGIYGDMAAAARSFALPGAAISPRAEWHAYYRGYVDVYRQAFCHLHDLYAALAVLGQRVGRRRTKVRGVLFP